MTHTLGKKIASGICIELKILHEELSDMVGTTQVRISKFMERIRRHGLLEPISEHCFVINE